jgi:hypothetical protein
METLQLVLVSILGFTLCTALLVVAEKTRKRCWRIALSMVAAAGLILQGALWSYVTMMLKALSVGGSYRWLYAALAVSGAGTAWALTTLGTSLRRSRCTC